MTISSFRRAMVLGAALLGLEAPRAAAQATTPPPDTGATSVGAVVVSATRAPTTLEHMALHTTVITRDAITRSPAQTLDQLLRDIPGMNQAGAPFYTTDPTGHQTRMRGITNSTVLVLLDGIPIHDPFYNTTQWFKVPLSSIDHIEVVRGGASSLWGNLAVAGVVNIITRKPTDNGGQVDVNYESFGTEDAALARNFVVDKAWSFRLSGDLLNTDGYQTTPSQYLSTVPGKAASSATNYNAELAAYYAPGKNLNAFLRAGYHRQNEDIGGYQYGTNLQKSPDAAGGFTAALGGLSHLDVKAWGQWQTFNKQNGAGCFLASATSCNTTATTSPLVQYMNSQDYNPYREAGASAMVSSVLSRLSATVQYGIDFRRVSGEDTATTFNKPTATALSSATVNRVSYGQGAQQFLGGFTQFTVFPTSALQSTLSVRYDYWTNTDGIAQMTKYSNGVAGTTEGGAIPNSDKGQLDPSLTARYSLTGGLALRGAAYRSFRAPGLNNLYRSFSSTTSITIANPHLSPQTLTGGELGLDAQAGRFTLTVTGFQYSTKGLIASYKIQSAAAAPADVIAICGTTLSNCPATVNYNTNGQNAFSQGVETGVTWHAVRAIDVDAEYAYTDSHYTATTTGDPVNVQLGAIPKDLATLGVAWRATRRWSGYGSLRYNGSMYLDVNRTILQGGFALVGLSSSYRFDNRLELYVAGTNLTDIKYSDNATTSASSTTLGMGRAFTSGFRWGF